MVQPACPDASDEQLLAAWCQGDRRAGNSLLARYRRPLLRYFARKVGSEADDLTQRTLLACAESYRRIRREASFRSYVFAIARHELCAFFRRRGRRGVPLELAPEQPDESSYVHESADSERCEALERAVRRLPMSDQQLIAFFYRDELSGPELATRLGIKQTLVRMRLHRARTAIHRCILASQACG